MLNLDAFTTAKFAAGLSPKTVDWYSWLLRQYRDYCADHHLDSHAAGSIDQFLADLRRHGCAPATVAAYYRTLRVYFGWLLKRGLSDANPLAMVDRPRVPRQRREHVNIGEFNRLYDAVDGAPSGHPWLDYRDRAILIVLFYSGLRVGEAVALHCTDVDLAKRLITVRHGKGGHARIVPCAPILADPLHDYLCARPTWNKPVLWAASDGWDGVRGALTSEGVRLMLRRRCEAAHLRYINPHQFRHGFAMTLLNAGMELSAVSAAMGHSSQAITEQVYAAWLTDGLAREYNQALKKILPGI
jgi:site-specific recombinase XerD